MGKFGESAARVYANGTLASVSRVGCDLVTHQSRQPDANCLGVTVSVQQLLEDFEIGETVGVGGKDFLAPRSCQYVTEQ